MYPKAFKKALDFTLRWEGGYVNDSDDPGGETNMGISKSQYSNIDIKNLTKKEAKKIYYADYWIKSNCQNLPGKIGIIVFDTAVNMGVRIATRMLQKAINRYSKEIIVVDGMIGPKTIEALKTIKDFDLLVYKFLMYRFTRYATIAEGRKEKFLRGWILRTVALATLI